MSLLEIFFYIIAIIILIGLDMAQRRGKYGAPESAEIMQHQNKSIKLIHSEREKK